MTDRTTAARDEAHDDPDILAAANTLSDLRPVPVITTFTPQVPFDLDPDPDLALHETTIDHSKQQH